MKKIVFLWFVFLILTIIFQCCPSDDEPSIIDKVEVKKSNIERNLQPNILENDLKTQIDANNTFAFEMYKSYNINENLIFSPYSITLAFALLYAGIAGESEEEIKEVLNFELEQEKLHSVFNKLDLTLIEKDKKDDIELKIENRIWGEKTCTYVDSYLDTIALNYGAGLNIMDFINKPEESRNIMNKWVEEKTNDRIKDLLPENSINRATRLVLTNAIYFLGKWLYEFNKENTENKNFYLIDGKTKNVPFMNIIDTEFAFTHTKEYQAIELPYKDENLVMLIVLPNEKISDFEKSFNYENFKEIENNLSKMKIDELYIPKWKTETNTSQKSLKKNLVSLGMTKSFERIDLSNLFQCDGPCKIDNVYHNAYISVNESGTEATAATAIVVKELSASTSTKIINIDRPFIYFILDKEINNTILFMGRVLEP